MHIPNEDMKKILAAIQRLIYDKAVLVEKDKEVINIINSIMKDNQND